MTSTPDLIRPPASSRYRWWIVVLLFFATTINYIDRQLFANLIPYFEDELRIGPMDLAYINVAFLLTYGLGMTLVGRFIDRVGVRVGLAITFFVWTLASAGHSLVHTVAGFILIRIVLGLGEAGNFPSAIKAVADWFPKRERALATGWFNCGSNVGAIVTPLLVPLLATQIGWRACFALLSGVGLIWLFFWWTTYRNVEGHPRVSTEERDWIRSDPPDAVQKIGLLRLLGTRQVYAISFSRFFTEAPWWFYLTWMPKLLSDRFGLSPFALGMAVAVIYLIADVGAVGGGWISSRLIRQGYSVNAARKISLLIAATGTLPVLAFAWLDSGASVAGVPSVWIAVGIVSVAASCHQAWSSNIYTIISDTLPKGAVATTVGVSQAFGAIGSSLFQILVAFWLIKTGNYVLPLVLAATLYFVGFIVLHLILPRLQPATISPADPPRVRSWYVAAISTIVIAALAGLQVLLMRNQHPYRSLDHYFEKRQQELKAIDHAVGPTASVGWQEAKWIVWRQPDGTRKYELVKFDTAGRPTIDGAGAKSKKYKGPDHDAVEASGTTQPTP